MTNTCVSPMTNTCALPITNTCVSPPVHPNLYLRQELQPFMVQSLGSLGSYVGISSSDPADTLFWHSFWHTIWKYIYMAYMHIFWVGRKEVLTSPTTITRHHWAYQDFFGDAVAPQSLHCALRHLHGKHPCNKGHFFNWQYGQGRFDSSLGSVWTTSSK